VGVTSAAGACFGRNYFTRYSAPEAEEDDLADERAEVLAEAAALKNLAADYMHPEAGVTTADGSAFGRNWFTCPSATEAEGAEEADERALVLAEAAALKQSAVDYLCPEVGVASAAGACFGRNYFTRYSAPNAEEDDLADERAEVLAEAAALKNLAADYMHPEAGVTTADGSAFGRNWFNRPSAAEAESDEDADERALVLAEAAALKQSAVDYLCPEVGITSAAGACFSRNYFTRYSAPETEEDDFADERAEVLAESAALKNLAADYMHPEAGVTTADGSAFGRNWFNRPSAAEAEIDEEADERALVLAEAAALKQSAVAYLRPEVGVASAAGACFGRNYFSRYSAPEAEEDDLADERAKVLAEAAALKNLAVDCMHPEAGVATADGSAFGRNWFNRPSANEAEGAEEADERAQVLAEAAALKQSAVAYLCPEVGVASAAGACFGRNYFNRYSAPKTEEDDIVNERAKILADAAALKNLATGYMHPEAAVTAADGSVFGRNFFNRYSAPEVEKTGSPEESQDMAAARKLAAAVKGAKLLPESTKFNSSDQKVGEPKKSASSVNLFGLSEGVF